MRLIQSRLTALHPFGAPLRGVQSPSEPSGALTIERLTLTIANNARLRAEHIMSQCHMARHSILYQ